MRQGAAFTRGVVNLCNLVNIRSWGDFSLILWVNRIFVVLPVDGASFIAQSRGPFLSLADLLTCLAPRVPRPASAEIRRHYEYHFCERMITLPGWMLKLFCNGARNMRTGLRKYRVMLWPSLIFSYSDGCALSSVLDTMHIRRGLETAKRALKSADKLSTRCDGFGPASRLLELVRGNPVQATMSFYSLTEEELSYVW